MEGKSTVRGPMRFIGTNCSKNRRETGDGELGVRSGGDGRVSTRGRRNVRGERIPNVTGGLALGGVLRPYGGPGLSVR